MIHRTLAGRRPGRGGFTLIELLIVIAIIGVLVGLATVAVLGFVDQQAKKNTQLVLQKVHDALQQRWSETAKQYRTDNPPDAILTMAGGDKERAQVIYMKLQLRRWFPMSYAEILQPGVPGLSIPELGQLPEYVRAIDGKPKANDPNTEAAACLLIALQRPRKGMKFVADEALGASAVKDTDDDGVPEIVDGWGQPITFFRWTCLNPAIMQEADNKKLGPYQRDTEDPLHKLMDANWQAANPPVVALFQSLPLHPITDGSGKPLSYYSIPVVVSAGKDGKFGLGPFMSLDPDPKVQVDAADNLYSWQTR